jgi:hypothetical protein
MKNPLAALDTLTRLRLKRVRLSIDDFGTGYSSLAQLRDIPFDELKVDRRFVHGACRDASLKPSSKRASAWRDNWAGRPWLRAWRIGPTASFCGRPAATLRKAYFIAKPMPAADLAGWVAAWERRRSEPEVSASMTGCPDRGDNSLRVWLTAYRGRHARLAEGELASESAPLAVPDRSANRINKAASRPRSYRRRCARSKPPRLSPHPCSR